MLNYKTIIATALSLTALSANGLAAAAEMQGSTALNPARIQNTTPLYGSDLKLNPALLSESLEAATQTPQGVFETKTFKKTSFQDINISFVGPLHINITEDVISQRLDNLDIYSAPRQAHPEASLSYDQRDYYKSTKAATGFSVKF